MIARLSGRPGAPPGVARRHEDEAAAEVIRRFFVALERLDHRALRALASVVTEGGAPEIKARSPRPCRKQHRNGGIE